MPITLVESALNHGFPVMTRSNRRQQGEPEGQRVSQHSNKMPSGIVVRKIEADFSSTPRHWFGGNPYLTHFVNSLSLVFPEGERMFVRSVKHFQKLVKDPALKRDVAAFIGQEMMHGDTHESFNKWVSEDVLDVRDLIIGTDDRIRKSADLLLEKSPKSALAFTVALEHLTSIIANSYLSKSNYVEKMHSSVAPILVWHAIEEIEHKSVAFDVYVASGGGYLRRVLWLAIAAIALQFAVAQLMLSLLWRDRQVTRLRAGFEFLAMMYGRRGLITTLLPSFFQAFLPSFHPSQIDDEAVLVSWTAALDRMIKVNVVGAKIMKQAAS